MELYALWVVLPCSRSPPSDELKPCLVLIQLVSFTTELVTGAAPGLGSGGYSKAP